MRLIRVIGSVAIVAASLLGCSREEHKAPQAAVQPQGPSIQDRARSMLLAAEIQLKDLQDIRSHTTDMEQRDAVSRQIAELSVTRDRLAADMTVEPLNGRQVVQDMSNLQRAMHGEGAAVTQPQSPQSPQSPQQPEDEP